VRHLGYRRAGSNSAVRIHESESRLIGYLIIFGKAYVLVSLTSANVRLMSRGKYIAAFFTGSALSGVWWFAAHSAANSHLFGAWMLYAFGAGLGTITGMYLGGKR
jgi:hypothetical protein